MKTLKRIIIGDIHGHWDNFKKIYDNEQPDSVIILGDYFDNFHGTDDSIKECFCNLRKLKEYHDKNCNGEFIMLIGNHDYHYINSGIEHYSGWRQSYATFAWNALTEMIDNGEMKWVYVDTVNNTIYSHAGVSNSWLAESTNIPVGASLDSINNLRFDAFRFTYKGGGNCYGNSKYSSPIWIRPEALLDDMYKDSNNFEWTQIVGHTHTNVPMAHMHSGHIAISDTVINDYINDTSASINDYVRLYTLDCMPVAYMREILDVETEKIISTEIVYTDNNLITP